MRVPVVAFAALVAATVGAFFVTQHLKVTTPLIAGIGPAVPSAINPVDPSTCRGLNQGSAKFSFYLLYRADDVNVYVIDPSRTIIRTLASGHHMRRKVRIPDGIFHWDGREDNGNVAPDGIYNIEVALIHQGRNATLSDPSGPLAIKVQTAPPRPVVQRVSPRLIAGGGHSVTIRYSGNEGTGATIELYRTDLPGPPRLVKSFGAPGAGNTAVWDGKVHQRPAPGGIYLVGLRITDPACNTGRFPSRVPPAPGSTPNAGVTVRYLAAQPPLDPVSAGSTAVVRVDSAGHPYQWSLLRPGVRKPVASGRSDQARLRVPLPARRAGLYELELRSASHATAVPLIAYTPASAPAPAPARTLVVLPALTWQGLNPVDDKDDGMPETLESARSIELARPFTEGLPAGFADEAAFLAYLDATHRSYQLTSDLGLIDGVGPALAGHRVVILAGSERWLPSGIAAALRSYVMGGGHVLSLGIDSLRRFVRVKGGKALDPTGPSKADVLGAQPATGGIRNAGTIVVFQDSLGIFKGISGALSGFSAYQPVSVRAPGKVLTEAGLRAGSAAIVGYQLGRGTVVDVGLVGFGAGLERSAAAKRLVAGALKALGR